MNYSGGQKIILKFEGHKVSIAHFRDSRKHFEMSETKKNTLNFGTLKNLFINLRDFDCQFYI